MTIENLKVFDVIRAFKVHPSQVYQMEARGVFPKRPRGKVTVEWLKAFETWYLKNHEELPTPAKLLVALSKHSPITEE